MGYNVAKIAMTHVKNSIMAKNSNDSTFQTAMLQRKQT